MKLSQVGLNRVLEEKAAPFMEAGDVIGRVISEREQVCSVLTHGGICEIERNDARLGDYVVMKGHQIKTRLNPMTKLVLNKEILATNFDTAVIVCEVEENINLTRLEQYLNQVWDSGALPIIALINTQSHDVTKVLGEVRSVANFVDIYVVDQAHHLDKLRQVFKPEKTILLLGGSKKAKQFLMNCLWEQTLEFENQQLFLANDCIFLNIDDVEKTQSLADIEELSQYCRFKDCRHVSEPGCNVLRALKNGQISQALYDAYLETIETPEIEEIEDYKIYDRKKDREKNKFTKKNNKDDKYSYLY